MGRVVHLEFMGVAQSFVIRQVILAVQAVEGLD
jgi:hypothetical protein